jgi:predicted solute-binding protein
MNKRLGIIRHQYAQPLFHLLKSEDKHSFDFVEDVPAKLAYALRQKHLDGAFLSPIDYAKDYAMYRIIPQLCAASFGESNTVSLLFNQNLREIKSIAVDATSSSEIVLAQLILREKYDRTAQIIPFSGSAEEAMKKSDAVLLIGDTSATLRQENALDLVEEWSDLTELPFIHGLWVAREDSLNKEEMQIMIDAGREGISNLEPTLDEDVRGYLLNFKYELDDESIASLTEFFRMAYYHGILKDIPDVKFHTVENQQSISGVKPN